MRFVIRRKATLRFEVLFCLLAPILLAGCGGTKINTGVTPPPGGISGNWQMSLEPTNPTINPTSQSGFLLDNSGNLTGGMAFQDIACPGVGSVSGNVSGSSLSFAVAPAGVNIEFTGEVTEPNSMGGNYTILSTGCTGAFSAPQTGTWTAFEVSPLNVTVQGTFSSANQNQVPGSFNITGTLTQGANTGQSTANVSGTLSTTGYCFFTTANVSGTISGTSLILNLLGSDGTQIGQISGTTSQDGSSFDGTYRMIGLGAGSGAKPPCVNGDTGSISWPASS
jgi:hypothetical protein